MKMESGVVRSLVLATSLLSLGIVPVRAGIETVSFSGVVTSSEYEGIKEGDAIKGSFDVLFDSEQGPCGEGYCHYDRAIQNIQAQIGQSYFGGRSTIVTVGVAPDRVTILDGYGQFDDYITYIAMDVAGGKTWEKPLIKNLRNLGEQGFVGHFSFEIQSPDGARVRAQIKLY